MNRHDQADVRASESWAIVDRELFYLRSDGLTDWANPAKMSGAERDATQWIGVGVGLTRFRTRRFGEPSFRPLGRLFDDDSPRVLVELPSVYADGLTSVI